MSTEIIFWIGFIGGRFLGALLVLSLVLAFVRNQTRKNIVISGVIAYLIATFLSFCGSLDGRLMTWLLAKFLLLQTIIIDAVIFAIATLLTICFHWNTKKGFTRDMPLVAGILYGLLICIILPIEIKEQYEIQKIAHEMTYRQFNELDNYNKTVIAYKIAGIKDGYIFNCIRASREAENIQDVKFKEIVDACRDIIYPEQSDTE